jgi:predicted dehydrogenase
MENLRAAVIGLGFVGRAHLEAVRRQGIQVKGLLSSSPDRGAQAARTLGLEGGYESLDDLIRDPSVDVVSRSLR